MDLEPGVINYQMLNRAIIEQGHKGEALRLSQECPMDYSSVTKLRLEFQKILRIDHLWMLSNLTKLSLNYNKIDKIENLEMLTGLIELDLSFNYIEKIENLDKLVKLEVLSLYSNRIEAIQNMGTLNELAILNLGLNRIKTLDGFERLRFLKKLKVFNLEENPIGNQINIREYVTAFLPGLKYYNYSFIIQEDKDAASTLYSRELRELREKEREEIEGLESAQKTREENELYTKCFVEDLNRHQLFDSLFEDVRYPRFSESLKELQEKLKEDIFQATQKIFHMGLQREIERNKEIESFRACINKARRKNQKLGQMIIDNILKTLSTNDKPNGELLNAIDKTWTNLMEHEISIFEDIEDETKSFGFIILDLMNDFIDDANSHFNEIQEIIVVFANNLTKILTDYLGLVQLKEFSSDLLNDNSIQTFVQNIQKIQAEWVNSREYLLQTRGRKWVDELLNKLKEEEIIRNRNKIIEINYFLDYQRELLKDNIKEEEN